jgi:triosephosphate isomerase
MPLKPKQIIVAPTFINLSTAVDHLEFVVTDVAAQNMHQKAGARGEISADIPKNVGVNVILYTCM